MRRELGFLIMKGANREKKKCKKMPRGELMLASGLGVYRFVMIRQISREQHQLVPPPQKRRG